GLVAAMLGVWQSGGAYVPLDPGYPAARLADMIADAGLRRVVVDRATAARLAGLLDGLDLVFVDEGTDEDGSEALHPDRLAYVIYTSGSTGKPKGVAISHGSLSLHMNDFIGTYGVTADDVVLQLATISFDVGTEQLLPPLVMGARVVMRGPELLEASALNRLLVAELVSIAGFATAYWQQWLHEVPA
ncbi:AMP-binding protein, partial [Aeromicrobium sp.]|uniref:AMP-binding protein n=1 Tax=Aeromicrobium sp. TaxID=1871063 RepID=UPI0040339981